MAMVKNEPSCNITYSVCGLGSLRLHMDVLMKSPHCILTRACGEETHHCLFSEQEKKKKKNSPWPGSKKQFYYLPGGLT